LMAFHQTRPEARERLVSTISYITSEIISRRVVDLDATGAWALAQMFTSADETDSPALLESAQKFLAILFNSVSRPVSTLVSAIFPIAYRNLPKQDEMSEILSFIPFLAWNHRKAARIQLVNAFLNSKTWNPEDLALAACMCLDAKKIFERLANSPQGPSYIDKIEANIFKIPLRFQKKIRAVIAEARLSDI
jgi:hypothetical protein